MANNTGRPFSVVPQQQHPTGNQYQTTQGILTAFDNLQMSNNIKARPPVVPQQYPLNRSQQEFHVPVNIPIRGTTAPREAQYSGPQSQVAVAEVQLGMCYSKIKSKWDQLKQSIEVLLEDLEFVLPKYFKETGRNPNEVDIIGVEDILNSYAIIPEQHSWVGRPLYMFVELLENIHQLIPSIVKIKQDLISFKIKTSLTEFWQKIEGFAEGKDINGEVHDEVSSITKGLVKEQRKYLPVISTVPSVLENISEVQKHLKNELKTSVIQEELSSSLYDFPFMLQSSSSSLSNADALAISLYRNQIQRLEDECRLLRFEKNMMAQLWTEIQVPQTLADPFLHGATSSGITTLEQMQHMFEQKVSMCMLKDIAHLNYSNSLFAAGIFDKNGGNLSIKEAGINLYIPAGAIPLGTRKEIYIYIDTYTNLKLDAKSETRVAPIIHCGPPGTSFEEPFVLSFPHCAENEKQWTFSGLIQDSRKPKEPWKSIKKDAQGLTMTKGGQCIIMVNHFTNFTVKGTPMQPESAKRNHMCTFGKCYNRSESYTFNVRAWNPYDKESVMKEQRALKETCMDSIKHLSVRNTGKDVKVSLSNVHEEWISEYESEMKISHEDLWYENEDESTPPSCRFRLKTKDSKTRASVYCRVKGKQDGNDREISLEVRPEAGPQTFRLAMIPGNENVNLLVASNREFGPLTDLELPPDVCHKLCRKLDVNEVGLRDWRGLATQFGLEDMIELYEQKSIVQSPTSTLLNIIKQTIPPEEFCKELYAKLHKAKIFSVCKLIEPFLSVNNNPMK